MRARIPIKKIKTIELPKDNLLYILGLALVFLIFFSLVELPTLSQQPKTQGASVKRKQVPELSGILSSDQDTRLKSTRALAERVGVEESLEVLKNSGLPFTGEGHLAVHQVGFYAYKKYGKEAILHCKDYFLYACYHGAIIEAASDRGFRAIANMVDQCKESASRHFQCTHASGHAIMAIWNYDLPEALKTCDQLFEANDPYPNTLSSCHNGVFMENLFGVHDWGTNRTPQRDWLSEDPLFPCNAFGPKYQRGCWLNQAARIYQMNKGNLSKTAQTCDTVSEAQYKTWCFDNLARQIHPLTEGRISKVFSLCESVGPVWRDNCIAVNAGAYYSVGDRQAGINICNQIAPSARDHCFGLIIGQMIGDNLTEYEKETLCDRIEGPYEQECFDRLRH